MESHILTLLDGHLYSDAIRLAEIYHAEVNTDDSLYYVALCNFKYRKYNSTYQILSKAIHLQPKSRLLLGQCAFELNKYHEAERILLGNDNKLNTIISQHQLQPSNISNNNNNNHHHSNNHTNHNNHHNNTNSNQQITTTTNRSTIDTDNHVTPRNNRTHNNDVVVSDYYQQRMHDTNPNANANVTNNLTNSTIKNQLVKIYGGESSAAIAAKYAGSIFEKTSRFKEAGELFRISLELFPYMWSSAEALARLTDKISSFNSRTQFLASALSKSKDRSLLLSRSNININNNNNTNNSSRLLQADNRYANDNSITMLSRITPVTHLQEPRRSTRLYSIENNNETPTTRVPTLMGGTYAALAPAKKMRRVDPELGGLDPTAKIFLELYKALDRLNQYNLDQSISILNGLPEKHKNTGWVLSCIGRALYEKTNYTESVKYYESARKLEPYRLEGMEYYSSALWHLHKEVELSILAKELMDLDQDAPQTWCVAGNCYSLQKEHESAIKYLEKAIKLDPYFAYAYTLLGHELISAERLDQATTYFRNAARLDPKHWNAWCGLGCIYYKNEMYENAELYYMKALKIAPTNPVLMCQLAVVQHALRRGDEAIETLTKALAIDTENALCRFHRATIYSAMDKNDEALVELDELKRLVPKESMVYFLVGKIHKKMGNTHTALMNFSWAMELDPKGANNVIRDVIDRQHSSDDDVVVHRD